MLSLAQARPQLNLATAPTGRFIIGAGLFTLAAHLALWLRLVVVKGLPWTDVLNRWDSAHYTAIASDGYSGQLWAFFPGYPFIVGLLRAGAPAQIAGTLLSCACFVGALVLFSHTPSGELRPATRAAFLFFLLSPASYVLHSHHTEGAFLLLSLAAFHLTSRGRLWPGAAIAGLCVLFRNQGVLVVLGNAALAWTHGPKDLRRLLPAVVFGTAGIAAILCFEKLSSGSWLSFVTTQQNWTHATGAGDVVRTLWLGNAWQSSDPPNVHRLIGFYVLLIASIALVPKRSRGMAIYCTASVLLVLAQAELVNVFRFSAVLFPLYVALGDAAQRKTGWAMWLFVIALGAFKLRTASNYAIGTWAY